MILDPTMEAPPDDPEFALRLARAESRLALYVRLRLGAGLARELEVEDLVQDVFVAAWGARERYEVHGDAALAAWLCRIAEHRIVDLARRGERDKRPPSDRRVDASALLAAARASATGPASAAARAEAHTRLQAALADLDDDAREVVLARHFEGQTLTTIAARTGRSEPAVRRLLGRATVALGAALRGLVTGTLEGPRRGRFQAPPQAPPLGPLPGPVPGPVPGPRQGDTA